MLHFNSHIKKIVVLLICLSAIDCENDIKKVQALGKKGLGVDEGKGIESYFSHGGVTKAKLLAPFMLRYQFDTVRVEFPKGLHVDFYDSSLQVESQLSAQFGRYLENDHKVFLRDSVVVFNTKGDTLHTTELYWDQDKEIFYTDKPVTIHQPKQILRSRTGMRSRQDFKEFTLFDVNDSRMNIPDSTY